MRSSASAGRGEHHDDAKHIRINGNSPMNCLVPAPVTGKFKKKIKKMCSILQHSFSGLIQILWH